MAASVGKILRQARTERGIELSEVQRVTKIRVKFLLAMEEDQWEELPAPAFARGFLSAYARFLGLDDVELVERYRRDFEKGEWVDPIPRAVIRPGSLTRPRSARPGALTIAAFAAVIAAGLVLAVSLGSSGTSDGGGAGNNPRGEQAGETNPAAAPAGTSQSTTSTTTTTTTTGSEVSLDLRATDLVWVCLVDERDNALVNGETLSAGQTRGPFTARGFALNLGNGSVTLTVDGQLVDVPALAEPLGYRVTPAGVRKLAPADRPTCA
jgi:cytoskeletal protein RodZ